MSARISLSSAPARAEPHRTSDASRGAAPPRTDTLAAPFLSPRPGPRNTSASQKRGEGGRFSPTSARLDRFNQLVTVSSGCWNWTGKKNWKGYGVFWACGRYVGAHRFSYYAYRGSIPNGLFVCHICDNPGCVNPSHLFLGTARDNTQDSIRKGRYWNPRGSHYRATPEKVAEALRLRREGVTYRAIADSTGLSWITIHRLCSGVV